MSLLLAPGSHAPGFQLPDQNGNLVNLDQLRGRYVVIYFYPRAMTPGCTQQACSLRDAHHTLTERNIAVLGISPDKPKALKKFKERGNLPFTLLSDADHHVAELYKAWQQKSMYGKTYMGIARITYLLGPDGTILHMWPKVNTSRHDQEVLEWFDSHVSATS